MFKKFAKDAFNKYAGNKDFLEAVCAASALVANADGNVSDEELEAAVEGMTNNAKLSALYSGDDIETELLRQVKRVKSISGRNELKKELKDVGDRDRDLREAVYVIAADVAAASGDIGADEQKVLDKVAEMLRVDGRALQNA
jgi:tellurite resistance protein TerB